MLGGCEEGWWDGTSGCVNGIWVEEMERPSDWNSEALMLCGEKGKEQGREFTHLLQGGWIYGAGSILPNDPHAG